YGVGLKNDSSFNVSVNGRGVRAVRLDSPTGTFIENYELSIPTYVFQPGSNTINFPPMPHFVELPKLELFMHSGFPITRWPDGHEAFVWLADKDDRTLAAALNMVGLATQRNGFPLFGLTFTYERPAESGQLLVVGTSPANDKEIRTAAPLKLLEDGVTVPYPVVNGWN